jgi:hypothetical protein
MGFLKVKMSGSEARSSSFGMTFVICFRVFVGAGVRGHFESLGKAHIYPLVMNSMQTRISSSGRYRIYEKAPRVLSEEHQYAFLALSIINQRS